MAGSEQNTTSSLSDTDNMAGSRGAENSILTDQKLLDTICSTNLCNELDHLRIPVSAISAYNQESTFSTFGDG